MYGVRKLNKLIFILAALLVISVCTQSCSEKKQEPARDNAKIVSTLSSPMQNENTELEHYDQNMERFGEFLKNVYTYECVYRYFITGDKDSAYDEAVLLKTKLAYAINHDYYLTDNDLLLIRGNIDGYLRMEYDTLDSESEYSQDMMTEKLFGISAEQYTMIRMCETLVEKCESDMCDSISADIESDPGAAQPEIEKFYKEHKDSYDYTVIRYISFKLNVSSASNGEIMNEASALIDSLESIEDMLDIIGGESDIQSAGTSSGQISIYMDETDSLFYEFASSDGMTAGAKTLIYDSQNVYAAMSEGHFTYETSEAVAASAKEAYIEYAADSEMTENILKYGEPEDWYVMTDEEKMRAAMLLNDFTSMIPRLNIADEASAVFITVQDPGNVTTCKFYAYEKVDGKWSEAFKTAGYVGRSGIEDTENRVEGNGTSPAGVYGFGMLFGIKDNPGGLKKDYKKVDNDDYWDGDKNSDTYNMHVRGKDMPATWNESASEHLIDYTYSYNYAAMVNFNVNPTVKGKGSAIFLHCTSPGSLASSGCISIPESKMLRALRMIDDNAYIVILRNAEDFLRYC